MSQSKISIIAFESDLTALLNVAPETWSSVLQFRTQLLAIYNRQLAQLGHSGKVNPTLATWV